MKLTLHHINLSTSDVEQMDNFYQHILGLDDKVEGLPTLEKNKGYAGDVAFVSDGAIQMHLAQKDIHAGFNAQQFVNPVSRGHIAFRTDDIASFKQHLTANNIPFADWGNQAVAGWQQIFFYDPDGNVIEVHQVDK
ncbi:MAG: VOC family protein [Candidatus Puniceispirillaceae bacterium]